MRQLFASGGQSIYCSFSSSISPSSEYSGLISFRIDWFDLLAIQGTLKSLLQHHNSNAAVLREGIYTYIWLIHFALQQNLAQHCKAIILQLKKNYHAWKKCPVSEHLFHC